MEKMLELKNVCKTFNPGTVNEKKALTGLNLVLEHGDFATIVGSNGAGKSTMFNAITGAFFTDEGAIILDGEDITFKKEYFRSKDIGHLFQDPLLGTAPHMTIEENMALAYLRASTGKAAFLSRISKKEKQKFRERFHLKSDISNSSNTSFITFLKAVYSVRIYPLLFLLWFTRRYVSCSSSFLTLRILQFVTKSLSFAFFKSRTCGAIPFPV